MRADPTVWSFILPVDLERKLVLDNTALLQQAANACAKHSVITPVRDHVRAAFTCAALAAELRAKGEPDEAASYTRTARVHVERAIATWIPFVLSVTK